MNEIDVIKQLFKQQSQEDRETMLDYIARQHLDRILEEQPDFQPSEDEKEALVAHSKESLRKLMEG